MLLQLAAEEWQVPVSQLKTDQGAVVDSLQPDRRRSYAELTKGKKIERRLTEKAVLERRRTSASSEVHAAHRLRGQVTGRARFAGDILFPDIKYARILRPPAHGATLRSVDTSAAEALEGVQVVRDGDFVAVLADHPELAEKALSQIKADYDRPSNTVDDKSIFDHILKAESRGNTVARGGDLETGRGKAVKVVEKTYLNSYVAHAPMEPHTAVAKFDADRITVWASTQRPFGLKDEVAQALGMPAEKVRVITPFVGGGFGGKSRNLQAVEAARLAKLSGKPVQVAWTRAEEFFYDTFRPAAVVKISAGMSVDARIAFWDYGVYAAGQRGSEQFYDIPHHQTVVYGAGWSGGGGVHPFGTGAWRAPANYTNTFARESHIDLLAAAAGVDSLEFRFKNLKDERMIGVLKAAAEKFGWKPGKAPSGRGWGIALGIDAGTYVAHMAEVEVDRSTGAIRVQRVVCAQDMGLSINPEGARIQMEGCITMGLGYALAEEIHFTGGEIHDLNFDTYEIPRFSWLPEIETVVLDKREAAAQGGGEPAIICMGAVVANAVFDACGARVLQLPMTPERVKAALAGG
ncbi:xanthine dehydrogenase family protein molybdopterin-binding subunit [bacterium]|nr:xanthine dehydrogenase family protein molybdopterin-binding subunit [bacterium]